jgi:[acyl-carrier-protein] S-malonyltransferase
LIEQVTARVRWRESLLAMAAQGVDTVVELGAGRVLSGLAKRTLADATVLSVGTPEEADALVARLEA